MTKPTIATRMLDGYEHLTDWTFFPVTDINTILREAQYIRDNYSARGFDSILIEHVGAQHFEVWGKKNTKQGTKGEGI